MKERLTLQEYISGIVKGDRVILAQAITLVESDLADDQRQAAELLEALRPRTGNSIRIGITGVPGVGKSTFIEAFGKHITSLQKKLAVLTVDPSSLLSKGSILGDKTRMEMLSKNPLSFIRPSATGTKLGGVASRTREAILLCEAAGYNVIIVETLGVGQSEVAVKNMVDFFLLMMLAGAGDELQGLKKGIIEMADAVVINKADGDNIKAAREARAIYQHAFHLLPPTPSGWTPKVLLCSSLHEEGIKEIWEMIGDYTGAIHKSGYFTSNREEQNVAWLNECFNALILADIQHMNLHDVFRSMEENVRSNNLGVNSAAKQLLEAYRTAIRGSKS